MHPVSDVSGGSPLRQALGSQWHRLPEALCAHHRARSSTDIGTLDIDYPRAMQPYLGLLRLLGVLVNRRGRDVPTVVEKHLEAGAQHWRRAIRFADGGAVSFNSHWVHAGGSDVIEYVNRVIGLRMSVQVVDGRLHFEGKCYVVRLGTLLLPLPEWLVLGHTTIVETALDDAHFAMDFRLRHPLFGQIFRYTGEFRTE